MCSKWKQRKLANKVDEIKLSPNHKVFSTPCYFAMCLNGIEKLLVCFRQGRDMINTATLDIVGSSRTVFPKPSHLLTNVTIFSSLNPLFL